MIYARSWATDRRLQLLALLKGGGEVAPRHPDFAGIINFEPIPEGPPTHSFVDCSRERASELSSLQGELLVSFSGGADCTLAAISMIEAGVGERLIIGMSETAKLETTTEVLKHFQDSGCRFIDLDGRVLKKYVDDGVAVITGCQGDTILNSDYIHRHGIADVLHEISTEELFSRLSGMEDPTKVLASCDWFFEAMPGHMEKTAANMVWWLEFCGDWHLNNFNITSRVNIGQPGVTHHHFFDSIPFQRWSCQDSRLKVGSTAKTHKEKIHQACQEMSGKQLTMPVKTAGWEDLFVENDNPFFRSSLVAIHDDWRFTTR